MTVKKINKSKSKKVTDAPIKIPEKQYTVFYTIGNETEFFIAHGTDYKLTSLDIKSAATGEVFSFPVVFVIDGTTDTLDIIPMNSIGNIRYNWGLKAEAEEFEAMQKKMKDAAIQNGEIIKEDGDIKSSKKKIQTHDIQYG